MVNPDPTGGLSSFESLLLARGIYDGAQLSPNTERGYSYDWRTFERWAAARGIEPLPASADAVSLFCVDLLSRGRKTSAVARLVAGIAHKHRVCQHPIGWNQRVYQILRGARRLRPETLRQSTPFTIGDIHDLSVMLAGVGDVRATRNRAIIVSGFCSAVRASSLVALELADVEFEPRGTILHIRRSKTDQEGRGYLIGLPLGKHPETCATRVLREWVGIRGTWRGPLFTHLRKAGAINHGLHPEHICEIVQRSLMRLNRDWRGYGSHSLRSGLVTAAGEGNVELLRIAAQTGHRNLAVLRRYFRRRDVFRGNCLADLDL
jgi:integrase